MFEGMKYFAVLAGFISFIILINLVYIMQFYYNSQSIVQNQNA